jgi:hypothetical protein
MSNLDGLMKLIPIGDIAKKLGINEQQAESAIQQVVPTLIGGMAANAKDASGAQSLEKALAAHGTKATASTVDEIDTDDGAKIVKNVFGGKQNAVASEVANKNPDASVTSDLIGKVLPMVAPIVLSWVGSQFLGKTAAPSAGAKPDASATGGIGGLLGGLLGGSGGQDVVGGLIGGLFGGGKR